MVKSGEYHHSRYGVVRYPTYYAVIDKQDDNHKIVFESRSREAAHRKTERLNNGKETVS